MPRVTERGVEGLGLTLRFPALIVILFDTGSQSMHPDQQEKQLRMWE